MPLELTAWPADGLTIRHQVAHTYGKRPRPDPPESFETWVEVNGAPISGRLVFQCWGTSVGRIQLPRHVVVDAVERALGPNNVTVEICVSPRA